MSDILKFLNNKKIEIDQIIESQIPKTVDKNAIEKICGKPQYAYNLDSAQKSIHDPIWDLLNRGGKRWRPALYLIIVEALGGDIDNLKKFAAISEVVHNGTLMIDDVEDGANLRRNEPTTHIKFGVDVAINAGNAMYYLPLKTLMNEKNLDASIKLRAYEVYCQEMINLSYGQGADIYWHRGNADNISEDEYLQMCAFKTGTLSRMAVKLAVVLSGGTKEQEEKLGIMAESIGVGFQIQDDILDITADRNNNKFGKTYGNDITEGKRTLMVIHALKNLNNTDRKRLLEILDIHTRDSKLILEAIELIKKHDSIEYSKNKSKSLAKNAWKNVDGILEKTDAKKTLESFINFLIERKI